MDAVINGVSWNVDYYTTLTYPEFQSDPAAVHYHAGLSEKEQGKKLKEVYTLIYKAAGKDAVVSNPRKVKEEDAQ